MPVLVVRMGLLADMNWKHVKVFRVSSCVTPYVNMGGYVMISRQNPVKMVEAHSVVTSRPNVKKVADIKSKRREQKLFVLVFISFFKAKMAFLMKHLIKGLVKMGACFSKMCSVYFQKMMQMFFHKISIKGQQVEL